MAETLASAGNPETTTPESFDPSTASAAELREMLASPSGFDREIADSQTPVADPVAEFGTTEPTEEAVETTEDPNTEPEATDVTTQENAEAQTDGVQETDPEQNPDEAPQETDEDPLKKMRVRPRDKRDQQVMDLYKSEGFDGTFQDAVDIIYARQNPQQTQDPSQEKRDDPPPEDTVSKELETVRESLKAKQTELTSAMEEFDQAQVVALQNEITQLSIKEARIEDKLERQQEERAQSQEQSLRQQASESRERAVGKYPALNDKDSIERKQFDAFLRESADNPALAPVFQSPYWPELMADRFADATGLEVKSGVTPSTPATQSTPKRPVTGTKAKQLTTGTTEQPEQTVTKEGLRRDMKSMSKSQLEALLAKA